MAIENNNDGNTQKTPEQMAEEARVAEEKRINDLVQARVDESLKEIKENLNKAYSQRDDFQKKLAEKELAEKEAIKKKLEEEGKHKELYELQIAEERSKREALEKRNTELSRDVELRQALSGKNFKNDRTTNIAFKEIVDELVKGDNGVWSHKSGLAIPAYVDKFCSDEGNAFLFTVKANSGSGTSSANGETGTNTKPKSLFAMSQAEVLKLAEEGKL